MARVRTSAGVTAGWACAAIVTASAGAQAQSDEAQATRRALIEQAQQARARGDHARAIELAGQAGAVAMSASLRLFLAQEENTVGRLAGALANAEACTSEVRVEAVVTQRAAVAAACQRLVDSLRPRVAHVVVHTPADAHARGVAVHVAGEALPEALHGLPYVVNPGTVVVDAVTPEGATFQRSVTLREGQTGSVDVVLPPPPPRPAPSPSPGAAPAERFTTRTVTPAGSYVVMAAGAGALIASAVFLGLRQDALSGCSSDGSVGLCTTAEQATRADTSGRAFNTVMDVTFIGGAALVVGGALWWLLGRHDERERVSQARWWFAPGSRGAVMGAGFAL